MKYERITTEQEAKALLGKLRRTPGPYGIDCETIGVDPTSESPCERGRIFSWSIAASTDRVRSIRGVGDVSAASSYYIDGVLLPVFADFLRAAPLVGHNIHGFDRHMFANAGFPLGNIVADTLDMHRMFSPGAPAGLKHLAKHWFGFEQPTFASLFSRPKHAKYVEEKDRKTRRKIEGTMIPTLVFAGPAYKVYRGTELIPLDEIEDNYPQRAEAMYRYGALDAGLALELYQCLQIKLSEIETRVLA